MHQASFLHGGTSRRCSEPEQEWPLQSAHGEDGCAKTGDDSGTVFSFTQAFSLINTQRSLILRNISGRSCFKALKMLFLSYLPLHVHQFSSAL